MASDAITPKWKRDAFAGRRVKDQAKTLTERRDAYIEAQATLEDTAAQWLEARAAGRVVGALDESLTEALTAARRTERNLVKASRR
jgi:hypothetical protein